MDENKEENRVEPLIKKIKVKNPTRNNFKLIPKYSNDLQDQVLDVSFNYASKEIKISIKETNEFSVFKWLEFVVKSNMSSQRSPFMDSDLGSIELIFMDDSGNNLYGFKLKDIGLKDHNLDMTPEFDFAPNYLVHNITFGFMSLDPIIYSDGSFEDTDEEWKTVKIVE